MAFTSSLQGRLTMGAHIFSFLDLMDTENLGQKLITFANLFQNGRLLALLNNADVLIYLCPLCFILLPF